MKSIEYPKVTALENGKVYVSFLHKGKRFRIFNGKKYGIPIAPNEQELNERISTANILASELYKQLINDSFIKESAVVEPLSDIQVLLKALEAKLSENHSKHHYTALKYTYRSLVKNIIGSKISNDAIQKTLSHFSNPTSHNTMRRYLIVLLNEAEKYGLRKGLMNNFKKRKGKAKLNKPFEDIISIIDEVTAFNYNLGLCCLITYGCLLRPHREVRELTWGDFSDDLKQINLSGSRNKSGRNRIVPVPYYVQERLSKGEPHQNIFTGMDKAPNPDYFKTIWGRFKKVSKLLEQDQTLYSFRHSGAIEIYKRTGSLSKLQKAMGHSSLAVSLTYLRGLKVAELEEKDMPMI